MQRSMQPTRSPAACRPALVVAVSLALGLALVQVGCAREPKAKPEPQPKVTLPAIAQEGVLRAGIDLDYPPLGGVDKGKQAGIDVDVAKALAADLGLKLEVVSVVPSEAASALASRTVDVMLSVPIAPTTVAIMTIAGSYISDGPAFFTNAEETVTVETVGERSIGAQTGSQAYWALEQALGEDVVQGYPTLRGAFGALSDGKLSIVAGDALVGAYISRDFPSVRFAGQLGAARPLAVATAKTNTRLGTAVQDSLDALAADGVLAAVRNKWVGNLPSLRLAQD